MRPMGVWPLSGVEVGGEGDTTAGVPLTEFGRQLLKGALTAEGRGEGEAGFWEEKRHRELRIRWQNWLPVACYL